jgi:hypothetical protein
VSSEQALALLEAVRADLRTAVDAVPVAVRQLRASPDAWSVAEVLEHLAMVEARVARLLVSLAARAAQAPDIPVERKGRPDLMSVLDRSQRVSSYAPAVPSGRLDWKTALDQLERARANLLDTIATVQHLPLERVSFAHFMLGDLDGHEWIEFVARHEQRHTAQLREIATQLAAADAGGPRRAGPGGG